LQATTALFFPVRVVLDSSLLVASIGFLPPGEKVGFSFLVVVARVVFGCMRLTPQSLLFLHSDLLVRRISLISMVFLLLLGWSSRFPYRFCVMLLLFSALRCPTFFCGRWTMACFFVNGLLSIAVVFSWWSIWLECGCVPPSFVTPTKVKLMPV